MGMASYFHEKKRKKLLSLILLAILRVIWKELNKRASRDACFHSRRLFSVQGSSSQFSGRFRGHHRVINLKSIPMVYSFCSWVACQCSLCSSMISFFFSTIKINGENENY